MTKKRSRRRVRLLQYAFGVALLALAAGNIAVGSPWYLALGIVAGAIIILFGGRQIFQPSVTRTAEAITCRFAPWFEGNSYLLLGGLPLLGVASLGACFTGGNPRWLGLVGILLLGLAPLFVYIAVRMRRVSLLTVSPSWLTVRLPAVRSEAVRIQRTAVISIAANVVPGSRVQQVAIEYYAEHAVTQKTATVALGPQITVQPADLLDALVAWKDNPQLPSNELLDRVERLLRGERAGIAGAA